MLHASVRVIETQGRDPAFLVLCRAAYEAAVLEWPLVRLAFDEFFAHLVQLGHTRELPPHTAGLFLCAACGRGDAAACKYLEEGFFPVLARWVARSGAGADSIDDVLQRLRDRLLVGPRARIKSYSGRGALPAWLRVVARSVALDQLRADRARRRASDTLCSASHQLSSPSVESPEDVAFRARYANLLERALVAAVSKLPADDRRLLHHYFVLDLGIDDLGRLYSVDRSTAARRIRRGIDQIRRRLGDELPALLGHLEPGELEGWLPLLYQRMGVDAGLLFGE